MRKIYIVVFTLVFIGLSIAIFLVVKANGSQKNITHNSILYLSNYLGIDPIPDANGGWLALHRPQGIWTLAPTTPQKKGTALDTDLPVFEISSPIPNTFLFVRAKGLKAGKVEVVGGRVIDKANKSYITTCTNIPGCVDKLKLGTSHYELATEALKKDKNKHGEIRVRLILVKKREKNSKQILIDEYTNYIVDLRWQLRLAGDLDRDGKMDLIIRTAIGETGKYMLYLSTHAKKNELVGLAGLTEF